MSDNKELGRATAPDVSGARPPERPEPSAAVLDREEVARAIDPPTWEEFDGLVSWYGLERGLTLPEAREKALKRWAANAALDAADRVLAILSLQGGGWQDISTAPKDGTVIWAALRPDIYPALRPFRDDLEPWNGRQVPLRHQGIAKDGFDIGWSVAAPVGSGGFPDEWIAGWQPLPPPPESVS